MTTLQKTMVTVPFMDKNKEHVAFDNTDEVGSQTSERYRHVQMTRATWKEMGEPERITVTIEPGDTLNG